MKKKEKAKIITLIGSTKFKDTFLSESERLTLEGNIVMAPCIFSHTDGQELTEEQIDNLKELHKEKIKMSDEIIIVNVNNYIGRGTIEEWCYARTLNKKITILYPHPSDCTIPYYSNHDTLYEKQLPVMDWEESLRKYHEDNSKRNEEFKSKYVPKAKELIDIYTRNKKLIK